jgi:NADH:ubiquinone oxidoreductase subunit 6 (subunit J)
VDLLWICLPVALGLIAVYLLLPRPHPTQPLLGALFGGGALVLAGWALIQRGTASVETVLFYALSCIAVVAGGLLVTQRNPVRAALSFALVVLSTCGLFLLQAAPFLMAATIIIYAGAIVVTFLFVIMLAQQIGTSDADQRSREPLLSCVAGFVLLAAVLGLLQQTYGVERFDDLLARAERAAAEANADGMVQIVGDNNKFFDALRHESRNAHASADKIKAFDFALSAAEEDWHARTRDPGKIAKDLRQLYAKGLEIRTTHGSVQPPEYSTFVPRGADGKRSKVELSTYSRLRAAKAEAPGNGDSLLPADNVEYLGRTLFSDYLLAVELGGTLLLVATIGAIAIAGRRPEGLR